jgi:hypothetical protein
MNFQLCLPDVRLTASYSLVARRAIRLNYPWLTDLGSPRNHENRTEERNITLKYDPFHWIGIWSAFPEFVR